MTFVLNPQGGAQDVPVKIGMVLAVGLDSVVRFPDGQYARVVGAEERQHHGAWTLFLRVEPVPTGEVLAGWGEYAVDVVPLEVE